MSLHVAVLRGGPSHEHDVSLKTGAIALRHLPSHYRAKDIYIDKAGTWHVSGMPQRPYRTLRNVDVVVNALHGDYGEDGNVQQLLEQLGIPYTGSRVLASALGMAKHQSKERFHHHGLRVPRSFLIENLTAHSEAVQEVIAAYGLPVIVKPAMSGSVGVNRIESMDQLPVAIELARHVSPYVLIEEYIRGKQASCGVVEGFRGHDIYPLLPVEVTETHEVCPGRFSESEKHLLQTLAEEAHRAIGARHYSHTDFVIHPKRGVFILEINTLPPLVPESHFAQSLEAVGLHLPHFLDHIIALAVRSRA
jgi:D-alanine--D-alanine ligase